MEIKKQVCSLEVSKKMKELGFVQESYFYWIEEIKIGHFGEESKMIWEITEKRNAIDSVDRISTFTAGELGEILPKIKLINDRECSLKIWTNDTGEYWYCGYGRNGILEINGSHGKGKTLVEAMSTMLIYLAEQKLIDPKQIKI